MTPPHVPKRQHAGPPAQRVAAIDIGTNSIKLLVAGLSRGALVPLFEESRTTRLGEGVSATQRLQANAIERTATAVGEQAAKARSLGATQITAVATSCAREAQNRGEFLARVRDTASVAVEIISGEREAELIFAGASSDELFRTQPLLVMDVGGGSAELISGQTGRIERRVCIPAGAVRMTERFLRSDPVRPEEFEALQTHMGELMRPVLEDFSPADRSMVGTGGTITTAAAMDLRLARFSADAIHHHELTLERLEVMLDRVRRLPLAERQTLPGLPRSRADIIVAGLAAFVVAMRLGSLRAVTVSTRGLRFGLLAETCGLLR